MIACLALASLASLVPTAAACTMTPLVTVGGPDYPADGVYLQQGCYFVQGDPHERVTYDGSGDTTPCATVVPVFVLGRQVPGTGATYCSPTHDSFIVDGDVPAYPDAGLAVCTGGSCSWVSTYYLHYYCFFGFLDVAPTPLATGGVVSADCSGTSYVGPP